MLAAEQQWTSKELARIAGVSLRKIQWWDEHRYVNPAIVGHRRFFNRAQAIRVMIFAEAMARGLTLNRIRKLRRYPESGFLVMLVKKGFWMIPTPEGAIALLAAADCGGILINIDELAARLVDAPKGTRVHVRPPSDRDFQSEAWMR